MKLAGRWKLGLGIGCGALLLVLVGILGVATWYAGRINEEYKQVKDSEKALIAATETEAGYRPPPGGIPGPERIEVFLAVQETMTGWRRTLRSASGEFARDQDRQRTGGLGDLFKLVNTGSDLAPVFAGFWTARNEALLEQGMGPGEYAYIYRLVYQTWLGQEHPSVDAEIYPAEELAAALDPFRERLVATYDPEIAPVELIFQGDE